LLTLPLPFLPYPESLHANFGIIFTNVGVLVFDESVPSGVFFMKTSPAMGEFFTDASLASGVTFFEESADVFCESQVVDVLPRTATGSGVLK
jgi:hypothetical protein